MGTNLNFKGRSKTKIRDRDIFMRTLYIEFEGDCTVGLGAMLGDGHTENKKIPISGIFPGKKSVLLCCGFQMYCKSTKFY